MSQPRVGSKLQGLFDTAAISFIAVVICTTGAAAFDRDNENYDRMIADHKLYLESADSNDAAEGDMSLSEYQASEKAQKIKEANQSLARVKRYATGGDL